MIRRLFGGRPTSETRSTARAEHAQAPPWAGIAPSVAPARGGPLASVLGDLDRVVVIDCETTGLYGSDRVVEVAAVTLDCSGNVIDEFDTLVNPGRDVGPTWLHGITGQMVLDAPRFDEIAGDLAVRLDGAAIAAHNLPFDARMVAAEFSRVGARVEVAGGLDTLTVTGCKLQSACSQHGVPLSGQHRALVDARATAQLVVRLAHGFMGPTPPVRFHSRVPYTSPCRRIQRGDRVGVVVAPPSWLAGIVAGLSHADAGAHLLTYLELVDRAMADLRLERHEREELEGFAASLGFDPAAVAWAHQRWVDDLIAEACGDGVVDASEYEQLCRAAALLGVDQSRVDSQTAHQRTATTSIRLAAQRVCFTGEATDETGRLVERSHLEAHAVAIGLQPMQRFTKSGCDLLVAADPASGSSKANNARRWGVSIIAVADFLAASDGAELTARLATVDRLQSVVCGECGTAWTRPTGRRAAAEDRCPDCAPPASKPLRTTPRATGPSVETLECVVCEALFDRAITRGRKPSRCPTCR